MTNVRTIHVDWYNQRTPSFKGGPQLAYQGDHLSNMVVFDNAPELPNYYLLVEMKTDDEGPVVVLPEIQLEGPQWVIPNYYTQICQQITYQVCCKTGSGDYEHHSAKFHGTILPVLKHNGEPIDQSPMFDPYIDILDKRVDELIVASGDIQIDSELKSDSGNPVQNRVVKAAIDGLEDDVDAVNGRLDQQADETSTLKNTIYSTSDIQLSVEQQKRYDVVDGVLNTLSGSSYNTFRSAIINVTPGETYVYSGRVYNYPNQYSLIAIDNNNVPLKYELNLTNDTTVNDYSFTIPNGATRLIIQSYLTTPVLKLTENRVDVLSDTVSETEATVIQHSAKIASAESAIAKVETEANARHYNEVIRSISRLGLSSVAPHNSIAAFLAAYKYGFRILLCDLRFTQDGDPVLFHDNYINQNYRNVYYTGGGMVPRDSQITVESLTTAQVQELEYRKTINGALTSFPIAFLPEMCDLVKKLGTELYIECKKTLSAAQAETACNIVLQYGLSEKTSWAADAASYLTEVVAKIPSARVATMPSTINANQIASLKGLLTGKNTIFMFSWNTTTLTDSIINLLLSDSIPLEIGSIDGEESILNYLSQGKPYKYVSGIESNATIAGKAILDNVLE